MPKTTRSLLALSALPVLAVILPIQALAQAGEGYLGHPVTIFERPPSVEELRNIVDPDQPMRTRGIEIVGGAIGAGNRKPDTEKASLASAPAAPAAPAASAAPAYSAPAYSAPAAAAYAPQPAAQAPIMQAPPSNAVEAAAVPEQPSEAQPGAFGFRINFAFDSAEIPAESYPFIDAVGSLMNEEADLALTVEGHTDGVGSAAYNQVLSERRAVAVLRYLVERHGVQPDRIQVRGWGESRPLVADLNDGLNRRVEFARAQ